MNIIVKFFESESKIWKKYYGRIKAILSSK